jgi:hypothetical protein
MGKVFEANFKLCYPECTGAHSADESGSGLAIRLNRIRKVLVGNLFMEFKSLWT